jgi:hypothetical protein
MSAIKLNKIFARVTYGVFIAVMVLSVTGTASAKANLQPEGQHDGIDGTVNAAGCSAFGWAVDPDNRNRDLQVRILSDGSLVATTTADLLREDVEACTGGTCGFGVNLWGLISAGEEHQIRVQAYDVESKTWVDLSGTPKSLTCWGYPEGFHDGVDGVVDANNCSALGWAADPDDRDRDLQVRILVDGNPVATTTANLLREDVGACTNGTCGFSIDLWVLISPDKEHQITAQAFDQETEAWLDLETTPKSLTCSTSPPPMPWMIAFPENDAVEGWEWPEGAPVYLTIDNAPEGFVREGTAEVTSWGDPRTYVRFDFGEDYDLQVGDMVTLTDGSGTSTTHEVQPLSISGVDINTNTVTGTANNDAFLQVWVHEQSYPPLDVAVASDGTWQADLTEIFDITYGTGGRAWVITQGGNATAVDWYVPNPHFTVFPEWEFFDGLDWPDGAIVSISVDGKPECSLERESWGSFFNGNFPGGCNIEAGDIVTFDDGATNRLHEVRNLYVIDVDTNENTVTGKADAGETVYVWPHDGWFEPLQTIVDGSGVWQVDLDDAGYTVREDSEGRSEIRDEMGNTTASDWHVTHPHFTVFPEWEFFDGNDWPNEAIVNITVAGKLECTTVKESWGYFFNGNFGEGCDIETGDVVTFTDGETIRTHTVQNLMVTKVNQDDDTVKGIADPGAEVYVWPHATGEQLKTIAKTQGMAKGTWNVDFSGIYDLVPGECGRSEIRDEFANSTAVDWCISNPRIVASESGDWLWTMEFKSGDLDISIYDSPELGANLLWAGQQVADERGFAFVGSDIHGQDLVPGNYLVVSDGDSQKSLILRPISVTVFDTENDFMAGFAPAGSVVAAHAGPQDWQERIMTNADPVTGEWFADFAEIGFDITEDMRPWSYAHIYDEDGDANEGGTPPPPVIFAHPAYNFIEGTQWTPGAEATVMINDPTNGEGIDYSDTQMVDCYPNISRWEPGGRNVLRT